MKYYIIAGEASGDLHGSNLVKQLRLLDGAANIRSWGGDLMQAEGATVVKHYRDLAFMGFVEVIKNLPAILKNLRFCKRDITIFSPDVVVLIDYPGFNIKIASWAKQQGYKVVYYISPQVWAWKAARVHTIKKYVDKMLVILPFEKDFYTRYGYEVTYVGHPLVEVIERFKAMEPAPLIKEKTIALLPGSRKQEINIKLPIMLAVAKSFPDYQFVVAKAPGLDDAFYAPLLAPYSNVSVVSNKTYHLLNIAAAALVTSGTATLETALFGVPEVVCYKGNAISFAIAKRIIKIKYISLVNLIMDRQVVKELIQDELTVENCIAQLKDLLYNTARQAQLLKDYKELSALLSKGGHASANAASAIFNIASTK